MAVAITAKDLTDNFSSEMRKGYIAGLVDMHSYDAVLAGDRERARCISDAFYRNDELLAQLVDAMLAFPEKEPVQVLVVMMNKACGS